MNKIFKFLILFIAVSPYTISAQDNSIKKETKFTEVITTDSLPAAELLKRAISWVKIEAPNYKKTNGVTTGSKAECIATFTVKPKELNPQCDYTGKVTMKVVIECKDSKYKYTVNQIKHVSNSGKTSAGSVDNIVPECGSMIMDDITWKKLKGEAMKNAGLLVANIKVTMKNEVETSKDEW
ncbi:MAG: DUF4468 domain-containing protein [Bacteroidetes bacterium]|nr:DUF4468 domain-containing protein [Bacteroidota bacterium]